MGSTSKFSSLAPLAAANNNNNNLAKRPHPSRQTQGYPRKRSMKACKTCRLRKTKCNNERPICAFCQSLGAVCNYEDEGDVSTLDPASQVIVAKLEELSAKLDESIRQGQQDRQDLRTRLDKVNGNSLKLSDSDQVSNAQINVVAEENELFTPAFCTAPDAILAWPVFREHHKYEDNRISDALFERQYTDNIPSTGARALNASLQTNVLDEDAASRLVEKYLQDMHAKDPFIEVDKIRLAAQDIAGNGWTWTGSSCLVMIISALGCFSSPHGKYHDSNLDSIAYSNTFYRAARRRVGILEPDLLTVQCLYFLGIYELHISRPLAAWKWLTQASSFLLLHLKTKNVYCKQNPRFSQEPGLERMEASLYWSCYKVMCDLRAELPLPASPLAEVDYPHVLPPPPTDFDSTMGFDTQSPAVFAAYVARLPKLPPPYRATTRSTAAESGDVLKEDWLFYMTDIILSRLKNRVLRSLYADVHTSWHPDNLFVLLRCINEFECKLEHWYRDLPPPLKFNNTTYSQKTHLHHLTQSLSISVHLILYTPMLYYLIHYSSTFPPPSFIAPPLITADNFLHLPNLSSEEVEGQIRDFANKALKAAIGVYELANEYGVEEWRVQRRLLSATFILSAGELSGMQVKGEEQLYHIILMAKGILKEQTEGEEKNHMVDVKKASDVIEKLMDCS